MDEKSRTNDDIFDTIMTTDTSADPWRSWWRRVVAAGTIATGLALVGLALFGSCAAGRAARQDAEKAATTRCRTLARVTGPEDIVEDRSNRRLLVSAVDRRAQPAEDGAIWQVPLHPPLPRDGARRMILFGRDGCSFRPHGIDLAPPKRPGEPALLYVINHHAASDSRPKSRCFDSDDRPHLPRPDAAQGATSIEVFRVEEDRLRFLRRLAAPSVLEHANDLVALPDGDLWVTVPPTKPLQLLGELAGWGFHSRLVHFECDGGALGCGGTWRKLKPPTIDEERPAFANGIAWRARGEEAAGGELFVASTLGGGVFAYRLVDGRPLADRRIGAAVSGPDNLTWIDEARTVLLAAAHPSIRRFLRHGADAEIASPSQAWEIDVDGGEGDGKATPLVYDDGRRISAASVALCIDGEVVLGQVFGETVEACHPAKQSACAAATREEAR